MYQPTAWDTIEVAAERANKIKKSASKAVTCAEKILKIHEFGAMFVDKDTGQNGAAIYNDAREVSAQLLLLNRHVNTLYHAVADPETYHGARSYAEAILSEEQEQLRSIFEVKVAVQGQWVIIKMPLLPSRYNPHFKPTVTHETNKYWLWYCNFFDVELTAELLKKRDILPTYPRRNLAYLHIRNDTKTTLPDADNFDTKHITDTVSDLLLGTDNPNACSFSSWAEITDELPESSYLCVSPEYATPPSLGAVKTAILASGILTDT